MPIAGLRQMGAERETRDHDLGQHIQKAGRRGPVVLIVEYVYFLERGESRKIIILIRRQRDWSKYIRVRFRAFSA